MKRALEHIRNGVAYEKGGRNLYELADNIIAVSGCSSELEALAFVNGKDEQTYNEICEYRGLTNFNLRNEKLQDNETRNTIKVYVFRVLF